jgi:hypothetical protein
MARLVFGNGRLAQLEERLPYTEEVEGSNPLIAHHPSAE